MIGARLDLSALRMARVPLHAPLCLRPAVWNGVVELSEEAQGADVQFVDDGVALVVVQGPLAVTPDRACGWWDGYLGEGGIVDRVERAALHPDVKALVFWVKSDGGTSEGILEACTRIEAVRARANKPFVGYVVCACSAAAWLASVACDGGLYGAEDAEIGSVGSYIPHESLAGLLAKEGIQQTLIADPPGKVAGAWTEPLSDLGRARIERSVKTCTSRFFAALERSRGLTEKTLRALDGDVLEGAAAVQAGLLDGIADLPTTVALALALAEERAVKVS